MQVAGRVALFAALLLCPWFASAQSRTVALAWPASTSSGVSGYRLYRGTTSGGPYTLLNGTLITLLTYTDSAVSIGNTYYYVVDAVSSTGAESSHSPQAAAVMPPAINSFTASPATITAGSMSTLSWSTAGATSLSISPGIGTVTGTSKLVSPAVTTTYTLTATNGTGSATRSTTVTVSAVATFTPVTRRHASIF